MRKILTILMLAVCLGTLLAVAAGAADNMVWMLSDDGTLTISGMEIPDYENVDDLPWYNDIDSIKAIVIQDGLTSIGNSAFRECTNLERVTIPSSVTSIGDSVFQGCNSLKGVTIPESVTSIGESAFCGCSSLKAVVVLEGVTIADHSFDSGVTVYRLSWTRDAFPYDGSDKKNEIRNSIIVSCELDALREGQDYTVTFYYGNMEVDEVREPGDYRARITITNDALETSHIFTIYRTLSQDNDGYYQISSYDELLLFASIVNGTHPSIAQNTGANGKLMNDIDANASAQQGNWTPIGKDDNHPYTGTFDGQGYVIKGLTYNNSVNDYVGLFGYLGEKGLVQNVGLEAGSMTGGANVGGVVGYVQGSTVTNCYNTGAVTGNGRESCVGGIVGCVYDRGGTSEVTNCYNTGNITGNDSSGYVGGIVGCVYLRSGTSEVTNCYNTGDITGNDSFGYVGGIVGCINALSGTSKVTNCYNTGDVTGNGEGSVVGGVVGYEYGGRLYNCYYDMSLCEIPGAGENGKPIGNENATNMVMVKGLTTAQMTGEAAKTNMSALFEAIDNQGQKVWLDPKPDEKDESTGKYHWFYPHLKGFAYSSTMDVDNWPPKVEVTVTWREPKSYEYTGEDIKPRVEEITIGSKISVLSSVTYYNESGARVDECIDPGTYKAVIDIKTAGGKVIEREFTITVAPALYIKKTDAKTGNVIDKPKGMELRLMSMGMGVPMGGGTAFNNVTVDGEKPEIKTNMGMHYISLTASNNKIEGLADGTYYLSEETAPNGYVKPENPNLYFSFKISNGKIDQIAPFVMGPASDEAQKLVNQLVSANGMTLTVANKPMAQESTPAATFMATGTETGTLSKVEAGMTYAIDGGTPIEITETSVNLTGLMPCTITVIKPGNGTTTVDSDTQTIKVTRAEKPTGLTAVDCTTLDNNDGKITGVTAKMQYTKSGATTWTDITGTEVTGLEPGTYDVHVKAAGTALASENVELTIRKFIFATVKFQIVNGSWDEGEDATADKTVTLTGHEGEKLKLLKDQIPKVGSKPGDTFRPGAWNTPAPNPETEIPAGKETVYTYTYAEKLTPNPTIPDDLSATYGQTLKDVELPDGWEWDNPETDVGNVGEHTFPATYTPTDTANYNTLSTNLTVTVKKADPTPETPTNLSATYGQKLSAVSLSDGWEWDNPETDVGTAGDHTFPATFTPSDTANYNTLGKNLTLTVNKAKIKITAVNKSKTYDNNPSTDPELTATVEGKPEKGVDPVYSISRIAGQDAKTYTITITAPDEQNPNYEITTTPGEFKITLKEATVTVKPDQSKIYGETDPVLKATITGLVEGESETLVSYNLTRADGENVGKYEITASGTETQGNYTVKFINGTFEIKKKVATVSIDAGQGKTYGETDPDLTATIDGTVKNETLNFTVSRADGENVGEYTITVTLGSNPNYEIAQPSPGIFVITQKTASITADDKTKVYGTDDPALTATLAGVVGEDKLNFTLSRIEGENVGTYNITVTLGSNPNYTITAANGTLTISEADKTALNKAIDDAEKFLDQIKDSYPDIAEELKDAIDEAKEISSDKNVTADQISQAIEDLEAVLSEADQDKKETDFDDYKDEAKDTADHLLWPNDSRISRDLVDKAKEEIDELGYDEKLTPAENASAIDAILEKLIDDLSTQREKEAQDEAERIRRLFESIRIVRDMQKKKEQSTPTTPTSPEESAALPFTDVPTDIEPIVRYVYERDIMNGVSTTAFNPFGTLTRGMIVTILHRMEGEPATPYTGAFSDVPAGEWYTQGVEWAAKNGIVLGFGNGTYGPEKPVTREQLAAILYRYAQFKGYPVTTTTLTSFSSAVVSPWATEYVAWAIENHILLPDESDGSARGTSPAVRWEVAAAVKAFLEKYKIS